MNKVVLLLLEFFEKCKERLLMNVLHIFKKISKNIVKLCRKFSTFFKILSKICNKFSKRFTQKMIAVSKK